MSSFVKQGTDCSDGTYKVTCRLSIWYYAHISYVFLILWKWDGKLSWELLCNDLGSQLQSTWWWISFHDKEPQTRWLETTEIYPLTVLGARSPKIILRLTQLLGPASLFMAMFCLDLLWEKGQRSSLGSPLWVHYSHSWGPHIYDVSSS